MGSKFGLSLGFVLGFLLGITWFHQRNAEKHGSSGEISSQKSILINEINTAAASIWKFSEFIEIKHVDECLFHRESSGNHGPSLRNYYLMVIKGFDQERKRPVTKLFINLSDFHFKRNKTTFVIGDNRGVPKQNIDVAFQDQAVVSYQ